MRAICCRFSQNLYFLPLLIFFSLVISACGFMSGGLQATSDRLINLTRLPTLTRTPLPTLTPTANSVSASFISVIEHDGPSPSSTPILKTTTESNLAANSPAIAPEAGPSPDTPSALQAPTPTLETAEWSFAGVQLFDDQYEDGLLLLGELINNTGISQELYTVSGTFYDSQGHIIADENNTDDYWPIKMIPTGGRMPFGMFVDGITSAANFELNVTAEPSNEILVQDFEFTGVEQWQDREDYCLQGELQHPDSNLNEYVTIIAILYDSQNNVVNFGNAVSTNFVGAAGDVPSNFEICIPPSNQNVSRYELRAWGQ